MVQNKRYKICYFDFRELYCQKKNGTIRIYEHIPDIDEDNYKNDDVWIEGEYVDIKLLWKNSDNSKEEFCYVLLKENNGKGRIIDLIKKQTILEKFQYNSFKGVTIRRIGNIKDEEEDIVARFLNKQTNVYALFSVKEKFIFGPYNYNKIEEYQYGVELDNKTVVENDGYVMDITGYINDGSVLYNKDKNDYLFFIDEEGGVYYEPEQDEEDEDILKVELNNYIYTYNKKTEVFKQEPVYKNEYEVDWSQYNDIAYEGYSRLELGLDD